MLYKSELQDLPLTAGPKPTKKVSLTAGVEVFQTKKCGQILAIDVYDSGNLQFRFFTDGKNYITWAEHFDREREHLCWITRNPFRAYSSWYVNIKAKKDVGQKISFVIQDAPQTADSDDYISCMVSRFISKYHWKKKQRAWQARAALMDKHLAMLPRYPDDLAKFCENNVFRESVVYITKLEKGKRWGECRHCGKLFTLDRSIRTGSMGVCPKCGIPVLFRGEWVKGEVTHKSKISITQKVDGQLMLRYVDVERIISADEIKPDYDFSDYFFNIFPSGTLEGKCYAYYYKKWPYFCRGWNRLKNGAAAFGETYIYTENLPEVLGTRYHNVDLAAGLSALSHPMNFRRLLDNLRVVPQAEYLFKAGLPILAADPRICSKTAGNFQELLGVSKQYLPVLRETQANLTEVETIAAAGRWVPEDTVRQLCAMDLSFESLHTLRELMHVNSLGRILRYLEKQYAQVPGALKRRRMPYFITLYRDYLHMANDLKSNMTRRGVLEPRDLKAQHDLLIPRINEQKEEMKRQAFTKPIDASLYWWAQEYANRDFTVVYPQCRADFVREGQCLNHCVGGLHYFEQHLRGQYMVFFIRKADQPDKPYFTTEIDVESGRIQQLYGYADCSAPKEVQAFVEGFVKAIGRWKTAQRLAS